MADQSATIPATPFIVPGQLTLRTIRGRNGPFTVGRLVTSIGEFAVKDAELEQYPEGKYEGQFHIRYIYPKAYPTAGGMRFEIRANLHGMTLSGLDELSKDEAQNFASQEVDPLDEEQAIAATPAQATQPEPAPVQASTDPLIDTTPFGVDSDSPQSQSTTSNSGNDDAALFGILWPLGESVKLDSTIDRRTLRLQIAQLNQMGYTFDATAQQWNLQLEPQVI